MSASEASIEARVSDGRWFKLYWLDFPGEGLPVEFVALKRNRHLRWQRICGLQIGPWFFGAVRGGPGSQWVPPAPATRPGITQEDGR